MPGSGRLTLWTRFMLVGAAAVGAVFTAGVTQRWLGRLAYDFDLNFWSEDYHLTGLLKLRAGQSLYGDIASANSSVYSPGMVWLHHWLLAPLSLDTSVFANKVLSQIWQIAAGRRRLPDHTAPARKAEGFASQPLGRCPSSQS